MQFDIGVGLPNKWLNCCLGEAIDYGKTKKANMASLDENTWVLELEDIEKNTSKVLQMLTFKERQSKSAKNEFEKGDILYGKLRPYLSKVIIANEDGVCSSEIIPIKCDPSFIEPRFLFYWLKSFEFLSFVNEVSYGVNMPRLGTKDGKKAPFRLAPLPEQKRIVEKVDSLLAQVETIQQRLNNLPDIIKRFRQSILAAAVSGKLTEQWRGENKLDKWSKTTIGDTFLTVDGDRGTNYPKKDDYMIEGHCLFLSTKNVRQFGFNFEHKVYISREKHEVLRKGTLERGDLIITTRGTLGHVASYDETVEHPVVRINSGMLILRKLRNDLDNEFFKILFASPSFQKDIEEKRTGSAQPQLPANVLKTFEYLLPTELEQAEIVRLVEQYFTLADTLEKHLADAKTRVDNLTQSVLAKAFRGELVPQNPNDEPADKLLERIKAARLEAEKLEKAAKKATKVKQ